MQLPTSPVDEIDGTRDPRTVADDVFRAVSTAMRGADDVVGLAIVALLVRRPPARRRRAGYGQDPARQVARQRHRRSFRAGAVHARSAARRRHRNVGVQPRDRRLAVPRRPGVRQRVARRRGQPGVAAYAGRAARADGRASGHDRRCDAPAASAVLLGCDREPVRSRGHLSVARQSARPVLDRVHDRAPGPRSRAPRS